MMKWTQFLASVAGLYLSAALVLAQEEPSRPPADRAKRTLQDPLFRLLDANGDGELSKDELEDAATALAKLDKNEDGAIDRQELMAAARGRGGGGRPGEIITPAAKGERIAEKLQVGDLAPDFTLPLLSGKGQVTLSSFQEKKPVVLIFASYT